MYEKIKKDNKAELDELRLLGEKKVKSLKVAYELTESELVLILKLHRKRYKIEDSITYKFLAK